MGLIDKLHTLWIYLFLYCSLVNMVKTIPKK